ncbi:MAG: BRCT domain-containing protein, partial [Bacillota bacterium]
MLELKNWYELHRGLIDRHPFSEIIPALDLALSDQIITYDEAEDLRFLCHQVVSDGYYDIVTSAIQVLHGIIHGILANNEISDEEIYQLQAWINDHSILKGTYPFDEINSIVYSILEDGTVTDRERNVLKAFFAEFVDTRDSYNLNAIELSALKETYSVQGICAKDPDIFIPNHVFCFTGKSSEATRDEIADIITGRGGGFSGQVSGKVQYLIVGMDGNPCWAYSCYGRKIEAAVSLRKKGNPITIVNETDFWNTLEAI